MGTPRPVQPASSRTHTYVRAVRRSSAQHSLSSNTPSQRITLFSLFFILQDRPCIGTTKILEIPVLNTKMERKGGRTHHIVDPYTHPPVPIPILLLEHLV